MEDERRAAAPTARRKISSWPSFRKISCQLDVPALIHEPGIFRFKPIIDGARASDFGLLNRLWPKKPIEVTYNYEFRFYDARRFKNGTIALYSTTGQSAKSDNVSPQ
jgi:hypothetical protein